MSTAKAPRPQFQSVELDDPLDARLEAKAAEKGIPTLIATPAPAMPAARPHEPEPAAARTTSHAPKLPRMDLATRALPSTPRHRMKGLKFEVPDYAYAEIKKRLAEEIVSQRYFLLSALRAKGIFIKDEDMVEDGRRIR
jgi:hypothetical protein